MGQGADFGRFLGENGFYTEGGMRFFLKPKISSQNIILFLTPCSGNFKSSPNINAFKKNNIRNKKTCNTFLLRQPVDTFIAFLLIQHDLDSSKIPPKYDRPNRCNCVDT